MAVEGFDPPLQGVGMIHALYLLFAEFGACQRSVWEVEVACIVMPGDVVLRGEHMGEAVVGIITVAVYELLGPSLLVPYPVYISGNEVVFIVHGGELPSEPVEFGNLLSELL